MPSSRQTTRTMQLRRQEMLRMSPSRHRRLQPRRSRLPLNRLRRPRQPRKRQKNWPLTDRLWSTMLLNRLLTLQLELPLLLPWVVPLNEPCELNGDLRLSESSQFGWSWSDIIPILENGKWQVNCDWQIVCFLTQRFQERAEPQTNEQDNRSWEVWGPV